MTFINSQVLSVQTVYTCAFPSSGRKFDSMLFVCVAGERDADGSATMVAAINCVVAAAVVIAAAAKGVCRCSRSYRRLPLFGPREAG